MKTKMNKRRAAVGNGGYTLIEMIVVMVIIVTLTAMGAFSIGMARKADTRKVARTITGMLSQCKVNTVSGLDSHLRLTYDGDGYDIAVIRKNKVFDHQYVNTDDFNITVSGIELASFADGRVDIYFKRSTGGVDTDRSTDGIYNAAGTAIPITVTYGGSKNIFLYVTTGTSVVH